MDNGLVNTLTMKERTEAASESWSAEQSQGHGIMGRRFPDGGLLRYRKWVPQQLGDVADMQLLCYQTREWGQPTNGSATRRHSSQSHGLIIFAVRVWSTSFPLFHGEKAKYNWQNSTGKTCLSVHTDDGVSCQSCVLWTCLFAPILCGNDVAEWLTALLMFSMCMEINGF